MRKKAHHPKPSKRFVRGAWVILWRYSPAPGDYRQYTVSTGLNQKKEHEKEAELILRQFAFGLTQDPPDFPREYMATVGVLRYLEDRHTPLYAHGDWIADYAPILKQEVKASWANPSIAVLKRLHEDTGGNINTVTSDQAHEFLAKIRADGGSIAWRNRVLTMCKRFFNWTVTTERRRTNPFDGIKILKEPKRTEIVYCTRDERERIIAMALAMDWPDWIAVPIAFYSGMRKEEIALMDWRNVRFDEGKIVVPVTKTQEGRTFPMSAKLRELLEAIPENKRSGFVVDMPAGVDRLYRMENLYRKLRKLNAGRGRWKDKTKNKTDAEKERKPIPEERIGWNAWRHTFGSLLAQSGVGLDKISSWMGNTPDVCRRHYAQFVPRDRHDEDIDKL